MDWRVLERFQRSDYLLICPDCQSMGSVTWDAPADAPQHPSRKLVHVGGRFHGEPARASDGRILIVCDACDMIQPD